jgi:hypothetical protein
MRISIIGGGIALSLLDAGIDNVDIYESATGFSNLDDIAGVGGDRPYLQAHRRIRPRDAQPLALAIGALSFVTLGGPRMDAETPRLERSWQGQGALAG